MKRILVVDDNQKNRSLISQMICKTGCSVMTASNGQEGLLMFVLHSADLVVTDFEMPQMVIIQRDL